MMSHLQRDSLPDGKAVGADSGANPDGLIVLRHGERVWAWLNICPHQGRMLNYAPGKFLQTDAGNIMCAAHGAVFDRYTGACIAGPCKGDRLNPVAVNTNDHGGLHFNVTGASADSTVAPAVETES
jgi:nitrite reductase/ring-hydroxylating ferredoxin subunit